MLCQAALKKPASALRSRLWPPLYLLINHMLTGGTGGTGELYQLCTATRVNPSYGRLIPMLHIYPRQPPIAVTPTTRGGGVAVVRNGSVVFCPMERLSVSLPEREAGNRPNGTHGRRKPRPIPPVSIKCSLDVRPSKKPFACAWKMRRRVVWH